MATALMYQPKTDTPAEKKEIISPLSTETTSKPEQYPEMGLIEYREEYDRKGEEYDQKG